MVYSGDLKSPASRHAGSSPASRTKCPCSLMVKKRAYTSPKQWLDKPQCAGSTPAKGTKFHFVVFLQQTTKYSKAG